MEKFRDRQIAFAEEFLKAVEEATRILDAARNVLIIDPPRRPDKQVDEEKQEACFKYFYSSAEQHVSQLRYLQPRLWVIYNRRSVTGWAMRWPATDTEVETLLEKLSEYRSALRKAGDGRKGALSDDVRLMDDVLNSCKAVAKAFPPRRPAALESLSCASSKNDNRRPPTGAVTPPPELPVRQYGGPLAPKLAELLRAVWEEQSSRR